MMLGIKCYQYSSGWWFYTLGRRRIAWWSKGVGCFMDEDNEHFQWRSDFERYLLQRLRASMRPSLEVIIGAEEPRLID